MESNGSVFRDMWDIWIFYILCRALTWVYGLFEGWGRLKHLLEEPKLVRVLILCFGRQLSGVSFMRIVAETVTFYLRIL